MYSVSFEATINIGWQRPCEKSFLPADTYIGEVRLVGGTAAHEGRVEIYYENEWGTLCDKHWDLNDARVICRQLGHNGAYRIYDGRYFGEGTGPILSQMDCDGDESFWLHCNFSGWNTTGCEHRHDSGVTCSHLGMDNIKMEFKVPEPNVFLCLLCRSCTDSIRDSFLGFLHCPLVVFCSVFFFKPFNLIEAVVV